MRTIASSSNSKAQDSNTHSTQISKGRKHFFCITVVRRDLFDDEAGVCVVRQARTAHCQLIKYSLQVSQDWQLIQQHLVHVPPHALQRLYSVAALLQRLFAAAWVH